MDDDFVTGEVGSFPFVSGVDGFFLADFELEPCDGDHSRAVTCGKFFGIRRRRDNVRKSHNSNGRSRNRMTKYCFKYEALKASTGDSSSMLVRSGTDRPVSISVSMTSFLTKPLLMPAVVGYANDRNPRRLTHSMP